MQPSVLYKYADDRLEKLSAGQKLLIRMGVDNATVVKGKLREIHERKPVFLSPEHYTAWLTPTTSIDELHTILRVDFAGISTYAITPYVNKPEHNDAQCIQPAAKA